MGVTQAKDGVMGKNANEWEKSEGHVETKHERSKCNCTLSVDIMSIDKDTKLLFTFGHQGKLWFQKCNLQHVCPDLSCLGRDRQSLR